MLLKKSSFTLLEIVIATLIIGTMILGVIEFMSSQIRYKEENVDQKFCLLKANQLLNEFRTYIEDSGATSGVVDTLDGKNDLKPNPLLTIMPLAESGLTDNANMLSGNSLMHLGNNVNCWRYLKTITVTPIGSGGIRQITVRIYKGKDFVNFPSTDLVTPINGFYPEPVISLITVLPTVVGGVF